MSRHNSRSLKSLLLFSVLVAVGAHAASPGSTFTMAHILQYPFASELAAAEHGDVIGWVRNIAGVRNLWIARGPEFTPRQITQYSEDDGQEITQITFSPDGSRLVFVRGGDHGANGPAEGNLAPDPASSPEQPATCIWSVAVGEGGAPQKVDEGDAPAVSARGEIAYIKDDHVWTAYLDGGKTERLFFDRGKNSDLQWSPDGSRLAFVSNRGDHSFIGIYKSKNAPLVYLAPSTSTDAMPRWSLDGTHVVFVRRAGESGPPIPILIQVPHPWSIWVASPDGGSERSVWHSPNTLAGSYPDVEGGANLHWAAEDRIVFIAYLDNWPHLYSVPAAGGAAVLLTPGAFMVEHVAESRDHRFMIYDANTGNTSGDDDRRHLFRVPTDRPQSIALTSGEALDWTPVIAGADRVAFVAAREQRPPSVEMIALDGTHRAELPAGSLPADFPLSHLITPRRVTFQAADGTLIHGQLFERAASNSLPKPGVIFVHGGPRRQMLLGWHDIDYYSNAYALNQYLASHGFLVLSVNYRLGIGYGRSFQQPEHAGNSGAAEYQDVLAGAHYLQALPSVDAKRIGIWGGSYGGYLTALALARNSDIFKAGVDFHGMHDWSLFLDAWVGKPSAGYEKGDREKAMEVAWRSSPVASMDSWKSPVLLIHGDDDRNAPFQQTVDLVNRLEARNLPFEELVIPNEVHNFLRHSTWLRVDEAAASFFTRTMGGPSE
jgi:dipeptidyl aminopeptidase/acylaminoacyl peptidase